MIPVFRACKERSARRAFRANRDQPDQQVRRGIPAPRGFRAKWDLRVYKGFRDYRVRQVRREYRANLVLWGQ